ncbi:hypothetical protein [Streptomyces violaceusniger]
MSDNADAPGAPPSGGRAARAGRPPPGALRQAPCGGVPDVVASGNTR